MFKKIFDQIIPNNTWFVSAVIFLLVFTLLGGGLMHGQELIYNTMIRTGQYDRAAYFNAKILAGQLTPFLAVLLSLLSVMVCTRKNYTKLTAVMNHLHWLLYVLLITGSQILKLKGN